LIKYRSGTVATAGEPVPDPLINPQAHGLEHPGGQGGLLWSSDSWVT